MTHASELVWPDPQPRLLARSGCGSQDPAPATRAGFSVLLTAKSAHRLNGPKHCAKPSCRVRLGLNVPIRAILENDHAFGPEDVADLTAAFEAALSRLGLVDRRDPLTGAVAKAIIQLAKDGERDPTKLCDGALKILGK